MSQRSAKPLPNEHRSHTCSRSLLLGEETSMKKFVIAVAVMMMSAGVWAHSGGTDSNGCHVDHKTGARHCH